jgi:nuclear pore complex protein Nup155
LWKYYVRNTRFAEAAQVLAEIAYSPGLDLENRLEYLTKAVTNAKSSTSLDLGATQQLLTELVDALQVAKIQLDILNLVKTAEEKEELNAQLYDINTVN